jgi:hypothetical protein
MGRLHTSTICRHAIDLEIAVTRNVMKQKTSSNPEDQNKVIKIKGSGPGSLTANWIENKNEANQQEVHKDATKKNATYYLHSKDWTVRSSVERFHHT